MAKRGRKPDIITDEMIRAVKYELERGWSFPVALKRGIGMSPSHPARKRIRKHPDIDPLCRPMN